MEILYDYMNYFDGDANLLCGCDIENHAKTRTNANLYPNGEKPPKKVKIPD